MIGHQVTTALPAVLALAERRLLESRNMLGSRFDLDRLRLPEAEGVDRPARPRATGTAMTITHGLGRTPDHKSDGSAKTASGLIHLFPFRSLNKSFRLSGKFWAASSSRTVLAVSSRASSLLQTD